MEGQLRPVPKTPKPSFEFLIPACHGIYICARAYIYDGLVGFQQVLLVRRRVYDRLSHIPVPIQLDHKLGVKRFQRIKIAAEVSEFFFVERNINSITLEKVVNYKNIT
jgi:hypothetical protein